MRAFTLVELAIVIVIAGILAAVALPIYQGLVEESKWSEGISAAGSIRHSIAAHKARHSGQMPGLASGMTAVQFGPTIKWESDAFDDLKYFEGESFVLAGDFFVPVDTVAGTYLLRVFSNEPGGPPGIYTVDHAGNETMP